MALAAFLSKAVVLLLLLIQCSLLLSYCVGGLCVVLVLSMHDLVSFLGLQSSCCKEGAGCFILIVLLLSYC